MIAAVAVACLFGAGAILIGGDRQSRVVRSWRMLAASGGAGLTGAVAALALTGVPVVGVLGVLAGIAGVQLWRTARAQREHKRQLDAWPDAIDIIRGAVRSGAALPEAMAAPAALGPEPLRPCFAVYRRRMVATGSFEGSLAELSAAGRPAHQVVEVVRIAAEVGSADVGRVLDSLSGFLRSEKAQRDEIAARRSWNIAAARVAVAAPWLTVMALSTNPDARAAYASAPGSVLLVGVACASAVAYWLMVRTSRLESVTGSSS